MNNYDSVFDQPEEKIEWVSFKAVGDKVAGTYIDLEEGIDGFNNNQFIVTLLRDGVKLKYGVRATHTFLVDQIKKLRLGQIVGFAFTEEKPSGKGQPTKIIVLRQNPGMVDEAWTKQWVDSQARLGISADIALRPSILQGGTAAPIAMVAPTPVTAPVTATPVAAAAPVVETVSQAPVANPVFDTVRNLAMGKGMVPQSATPAEVDAKIKEVTGLDITAENITAIIVAITSLPNN
jgi:hypothetical protein